MTKSGSGRGSVVATRMVTRPGATGDDPRGPRHHDVTTHRGDNRTVSTSAGRHHARGDNTCRPGYARRHHAERNLPEDSPCRHGRETR